MTESDKTEGPNRVRKSLRIAVTGTGGRLGGALKRLFEPYCEVIAFHRGNLDLADENAVVDVLSHCEFDVLINPAAMTSVDVCESENETAYQVNARAPELMANVCKRKGSRFIHVSTDYVFDGVESGLRTETDPTGPMGIYGKTKKEGELRVLAADSSALVVRTSWVFGPERPAFPDSIIKRAMAEDTVEAIADKWSSPTFADDFGNYLEPLLLERGVSGILHLCNSGSCSWQEYGQEALDVALRLGLPLKATSVDSLRLEDMAQFVVPRPVHTAMNTMRYEELGFGKIRSWKSALTEYLEKEFKVGKLSGS